MKLLTDTEKRDLVYIPACLLNATIGIAVGQTRKLVERAKA